MLISRLWDLGTSGVFEGPDGRVIAGFESQEQALAAVPVIEQAAVVTGSVTVEPADEPGRWSSNTEARPITVTVGDHRFTMDIIAGPTFGHGGHPTTELALELLCESVIPGMTVLDLGTGSGVLAVAAAMAGATVLAIDNDPAAVPVAKANAAANGVATAVAVGTETVAEARERAGRPFDLVVMNVLLPVHQALAEAVQAALAPVGTLIISGYLMDQRQAAIDCHRQARPGRSSGLVVIDGRAEEPWAADRFRARG